MSPAPIGRVGLNDVSVLLPLPSSYADPNTLRLGTAGNGGPLLTEEMFAAIPPFAENPVAEQAYAQWRIVAARIDPCFPDLALLSTNPSACRRQLRLVAQPFDPSVSSVPVAFGDHAMHLLYDLSADDFAEMSTRWLALGSDATSSPSITLGVHPGIAAEGLGGATASELRAIVATYAGATTLSQFTFVEGGGVFWSFGGFKIVGGQRVVIEIPHATDEPAMKQTTTSNEAGTFAVQPETTTSLRLAPLVGEVVSTGVGGDAARLTASSSEIREALQVTADIDNPTSSFNGDSLDCSSCHVATRARLRAKKLGASIDGLVSFTAPGFSLDLDVAQGNDDSPQQQRAFGYNAGMPIWNQRTVNESAAVAAYFASEQPALLSAENDNRPAGEPTSLPRAKRVE